MSASSRSHLASLWSVFFFFFWSDARPGVNNGYDKAAERQAECNHPTMTLSFQKQQLSDDHHCYF